MGWDEEMILIRKNKGFRVKVNPLDPHALKTDPKARLPGGALLPAKGCGAQYPKIVP